MTTTLITLNIAIDEAGEDLYYAEEAYGETQAQHLSETSLYGDSWPGARQDLARMKAGIARLEARWASLVADRDARFPVAGPPAPPVVIDPSDEEPF